MLSDRYLRHCQLSPRALRYRLKKLEEGVRRDGRAAQPTALDGYEEAVEAIQRALDDGRLTGEGRPAQARQIYELLIRDHGYGGSYQAVVRHLRRKHGRPRLRALRRVETPPGVQAQHDWFEVRVPLGTRERRIQALIGTLSYSRAKFCWVSRGSESAGVAHGPPRAVCSPRGCAAVGPDRQPEDGCGERSGTDGRPEPLL